jgi:four helix bundle protein
MDFKKLLVWQKANRLMQKVDLILPRVRRKRPKLADQLERACESVGACIAEGRGRPTDKDFSHFLSTAIASVNELEHHLLRAYQIDAILEEEMIDLTNDAIEVRKMLIGLRKRLNGDDNGSR